jgi:predicted nuclease of predicted toxin-antitoxin system
VKLLLDENISRRIVSALAPVFPGTSHIESVGLAGATDLSICEYASEHNFVVVTKDEDFDRLVSLRHFKPKLIRLVMGNSTNDEIAQALLGVAAQIIAELEKPDQGIVEIG